MGEYRGDLAPELIQQPFIRWGVITFEADNDPPSNPHNRDHGHLLQCHEAGWQWNI